MVASWRFRNTPNVSFFFERGCALSGRLDVEAPEGIGGGGSRGGMGGFATAFIGSSQRLRRSEMQLEEVDELGTPYLRAVNDDILY